jgi:hypothetical protein
MNGRIKLLIAAAVLLAAGSTFLWFVTGGKITRVDTSFATSASLRYHYNDKTLDAKVTDPKEVAILRDMLSGFACEEVMACGFTDNVSVTLSGHAKSIMFLPALSGDPIFAVDGSWQLRHVSAKQKRAFDRIWKRHGLIFP